MNYITPQKLSNIFDYQVKLQDVENVYRFYMSVLERLSPNDAHFLKQRDRVALSNHLKSGMPILAWRQDRKIVGTVMLTYPDNKKACHLSGYPITANEEKTTCVIHGLAVDSDMAGKGISGKLLGLSAAFSLEVGRYDLMAKVASDNQRSLDAFQSAGFHIIKSNGQSKWFGGDAINVWNMCEERMARLLRKYGRPTIG